MDPQGQIAIVTGSASGLGRAVAQALTARGARVAGIDLPPREGTPSLPEPGIALALHGSVADAAQMEAAFARVNRELGRPSILVNCAGILGPARVFRIDRETGAVSPREMDRFRQVIDVNLTGTFNTIRLFAAGLAQDEPNPNAQDRGVIVNTASVAAYEALSAQAAYGSSKAGVAAMTLPLTRELARYGIRVMALAPGTFETGMFDHIPDHTRARLIDDVPFPNRAGRAEEFAQLALTCVENQMLNGSVLRIDGGVRMREPQELPA